MKTIHELPLPPFSACDDDKIVCLNLIRMFRRMRLTVPSFDPCEERRQALARRFVAQRPGSFRPR